MEKLVESEEIIMNPCGEKACTVILPLGLTEEEMKQEHYNRIMKAPTGSTVCFPDGQYRTYELWGSEVALLISLPEGLNILELGTSFGGSAALLSLKANIVVTIDMFDAYRTSDPNYAKRWTEFNVQYVMEGLTQFNNIVPIVGDTKLVVPCLKDDFFDFAFIDAGHTYEDVKSDMEAVYPKLKSSSIVMFHDFFFPESILNILSEKQKADAKSYAGINQYVHEIVDDKYIKLVGISGLVKKENIHL